MCPLVSQPWAGKNPPALVRGFSASNLNLRIFPLIFPSFSNSYHLVNIQKTMGNHHFQWENSLYMAIFNSYVKLPEGMVFCMFFFASFSAANFHGLGFEAVEIFSCP